MRLVYFGSGEFGVPTFRRLAREHEIELVVTQPDRPAGRKRESTPTPIAVAAEGLGLPISKPEKVNDEDVVSAIRAAGADAFVVIAYGQKLGQRLLQGMFAINLHASLLPRHRGAAPVNWAIIRGDATTGVSVITLADRMDAGDILGQAVTPIDPMETAGELHDRLSLLGPDLVSEVLARSQTGRLTRQPQDERQATQAPKFTKADGTVSFDQPAAMVRNRIHGLTPWPGCWVELDGKPLRLHRVFVTSDNETADAPPGTMLDGDRVLCAPGSVRLLAVQAPGGKVMAFSAYRMGHPVSTGALLRPWSHEATEHA